MSYLQSRNRNTDIKNKCMDTKRGGGVWWNELGDRDCHTYRRPGIKQITNESLPCGTRNSTQRSVVT